MPVSVQKTPQNTEQKIVVVQWPFLSLMPVHKTDDFCIGLYIQSREAIMAKRAGRKPT
jgi:hypothetical protein